MPFDDDAADDVTGFGPPPHPDDRLWRHPSELDDSGPRFTRGAAHRWHWGLVAGVGTVGVVLVGVGALAFGLRDRVVAGRAAAPAGIGPIVSEPLTAFESQGIFSGPAYERPQQVTGFAPTVVGVEGVRTGSGVVVRSDGIVLTSADVVGTLPDVQVTFDDGSTARGNRVGSDPVTGLAVVDLPGDGFDAARLVAPEDLASGGTVLCAGRDGKTELLTSAGTIGRPYTQVSTGNRSFDGVIEIRPELPTSGWMQGGVVVDGKGDVLALTTWSDQGAYYATPIDVAGKVADDLLATGTAQHSWIGIEGTDASGGRGALVTSVDDRGPAEDSLRALDVVVELDGEAVTDMSTLVALLQSHRPGDEVEVTYERGGRTATATVTLDPLPED